MGLDHERHDGGWRRVVIEKPFGHDLDSAVRLNREVGKVFRERQVYRIDHYLGKETVRNLLVFRFGNGIFEPIWNRRHIDHVQITVAESIGIENRGSFYEETGASRDFLQNHLLQLLSLVAMEPPATFEADALRDEKVKVIRAVTELSPRAGAHGRRPRPVRRRAGSGPSRSIGYRDEPEVDPQSETETFIAARLTIDDWRWSGVPFYLRMGKRLPKRATEIAIQFKEVPHQLFKDSATDPEANLLAMRIQPDEGIMLRFGAKVPGLGIDVRNVTMDFTYGSAFQVDSPDAYETLILDVAARRRVAVHPRRRGRGGVGHRRPDHRHLGRDAAARRSRTTRPARGAPRRPRTCSPAKAGAGAGSDGMTGEARSAAGCLGGRPASPRRAARRSRGPPIPRRAARTRAAASSARSSRSGRAPPAADGSSWRTRRKPGEPTMRWLSHAHSIDEIETELTRIWAQPNLADRARRARRRAGTSPRGRR